jgi:hypothetical protein
MSVRVAEGAQHQGFVDESAPYRGESYRGDQPGARLVYLDNLKVVLVVGVIVAHSAMTYGAAGTWVFEAKEYGGPTLSSATSELLSAGIGLGILFGMGLFLMMAGLVTPPSLRRKGAAAFVRGRVLRLGIPVIVYAALVMPVLALVIMVTASRSTEPIPEFLGHRVGELSTGPAWFIAVLLIMSLGYVGWHQTTGRRHASTGPLGWHHLVVAATLIGAGTFVVRIWWPLDSPQVLDLHVWLWPQCAVLFALGAISAERGWLQPVPRWLSRASGRVSLVGLLTLTAVLVATGRKPTHAFVGGVHWQAAVVAGLEGILAIGLSLWMLARFQQRHNDQGRVGRVLSRHAFGAFLLQAPVLVGVALFLQPLHVPGDLAFALLAAGSVSACFALSALFARTRHIRPAVLRREVE